MTEAIELDLIEVESVVLNLDDTETVELNIIEQVITLDVLGEVGPRGRPGIDSGSYRHTQSVPSAVWEWTHNLGYRPAVTATDSAGSVVYGDVLYVDLDTVRITFEYPFGGFAECS